MCRKVSILVKTNIKFYTHQTRIDDAEASMNQTSMNQKSLLIGLIALLTACGGGGGSSGSPSTSPVTLSAPTPGKAPGNQSGNGQMPDTSLAGSQTLTASLVGSQIPDASLVGSRTLTASLENPDNIMSLTLEINGIEVHTWAASDLQAGEQTLTYMLSEREAQDILIHSQIELAYKLTAAQMEGEDLVKQETVSRTRPTPQFTANVFEPSGYFDQVCATPRVGLDRQGTTLHEKYWIRSFSHETYLWHDELTDIDPASIESKFTYFNRMRTRAFVRTGRAKDRHHGATNTERYRQRQNAAPKPSFGFDRSGSTLRNVYPGFPADTAGLKRGDVIVSATPAGWTSPVAGTAYTFTIRGRGSASTRQVSLTPQVLSKPPVQHVKVIDTDSGDTDSSEKVGYMAFFRFQPTCRKGTG